MCPRPRPGAGDGDILVAGHKRSPAVTVVTTHGQMVRQRHGDKLQEFLPHSTLGIAAHSRDGSRLMGGPGLHEG